MSLLKWLYKKPPRGPPDYLDTPFFVAGGETILTIRSLVQGILCTGIIGSGKTTGFMATMLDHLLRLLGAGFLQVCAKEGDCQATLDLARKYGRECIVIGPDKRHRLNLFDCLCNTPMDAPTLAMSLGNVLEGFMQAVERERSSGHGNDPFWHQGAVRLLRSILLMILLASQVPTASLILRVLANLPSGRSNKNWKTGVTADLMRAAYMSCHQNGWGETFDQLSTYIRGELPVLASRTRSIFVSHVTGMLDGLSRGITHEILGTTSTFSMAEAIQQGTPVILNFPLNRWPVVAQFLGIAFKTIVQMEVQKRAIRPDTPPYALILDEYPAFWTEADHSFVATSREYRAPVVAAAQSVEQFHALFSGENGRSKANTLLGQLPTKVCCLPDMESAKFYSELLGQELKFLSGSSVDAGAYSNPLDLLGWAENPPRISASSNQHLLPVIRGEEIQAAIRRTGGPPHFIVEAMVAQTGRTFADGRAFKFIQFSQRR